MTDREQEETEKVRNRERERERDIGGRDKRKTGEKESVIYRVRKYKRDQKGARKF